jgi:proline iminopeptidase
MMVPVSVPVSGAELHCSEQGQGPVCLFLCAFGTGPNEHQTPTSLTERFRFVYVDLRGSGRSTGEIGDLTFDLLARDLEAVRTALGVPRVAVLGASILGALAIEYGRRCPDTVSHVITAGTPPSGDMGRMTAAGTAYFEQHASEERKRILRDNLAALPPGTPPAQTIFAQAPLRFHDPHFDARPLFAEAMFKPDVLMHLMGTLTPSWDITADAGSLRVPIFVATGRYDYVSPHLLWKDVAPRLPNVTLKIFEKSGHQPFFEEPEAFAAAVTAWMSGRR